jgi:hypothetical protein
MLDDRDVFYGPDVTEWITERGLAPKWCSSLYLAFNLLAAHGVRFNLSNFSLQGLVISLALWGFTLGILIYHNKIYKRIDRTPDAQVHKKLGFPYHT